MLTTVNCYIDSFIENNMTHLNLVCSTRSYPPGLLIKPSLGTLIVERLERQIMNNLKVIKISSVECMIY